MPLECGIRLSEEIYRSWISRISLSQSVFGFPLRNVRSRAMVAMPVPSEYKVVPDGTPTGQAYNVAQVYARAADALRDAGSFDVDFTLAVQRHKMIDAIERSSATGRSVRIDQG